MGDQNSEKPETPSGEVEILPPEDRRRPWGDGVYSSHFERVKIVRLGPVASALMGFGFLLMLTLGFLFLGGALLLLLPIAAVLTLAGILSGLLANPFKRLR